MRKLMLLALLAACAPEREPLYHDGAGTCFGAYAERVDYVDNIYGDYCAKDCFWHAQNRCHYVLFHAAAGNCERQDITWALIDEGDGRNCL